MKSFRESKNMLINKNDYRLTCFENFDNQNAKIIELHNSLKLLRTDNHYSILRNNSKHYKKDFMKLFLNKCCYCGFDFSISGKYYAQIDHINSSEPKDNTLPNLAPSCSMCNEGKKAMGDTECMAKMINPYKSIQSLFIRNEDYSISIKEAYQEDPNVISFYKKVKLDWQLRRFDYLLSCIKALMEIQKDTIIRDYLKDIFYTLSQKRRDDY